jgi:hypothetical protein
MLSRKIHASHRTSAKLTLEWPSVLLDKQLLSYTGDRSPYEGEGDAGPSINQDRISIFIESRNGSCNAGDVISLFRRD